jgi:hypothetical protein
MYWAEKGRNVVDRRAATCSKTESLLGASSQTHIMQTVARAMTRSWVSESPEEKKKKKKKKEKDRREILKDTIREGQGKKIKGGTRVRGWAKTAERK